MDSIPLILQYIVPGYLCLTTVKVIRHIELDLSVVWMLSIVISALTASLVSIFFPDTSTLPWIVLVYSALDVLLGAIVAWIYELPKAQNALTALFHIVPGISVLRDAVDWTNGADLKIRLKDADYYLMGHIYTVGGTGEDQWVSISNPERLTLDNEKKESWEGDNRVYMVIPLSEVQYITVLNGSDN